MRRGRSTCIVWSKTDERHLRVNIPKVHHIGDSVHAEQAFWSGRWQVTLKALKITVSQIEFDIMFVELGTLHATGCDKANIERIFVGADFRHTGEIARE
jgi:hypothetical protein